MEELENTENGPIPKSDDVSTSPAKSCALCGCSTPAVRCDRCSSQTFCLSCDDMYHRHPKRRLHLRKAVDSIWSSTSTPRLRRRTDLPGDPSKIPIPPPRSKKRERSTIGGRMFLKPGGLELGSFGHSKMFDRKSLTPPPKDMYAKPKMTANVKEETYENETTISKQLSTNIQKPEEIYENDNAMNEEDNRAISAGVDHSPWNSPRTNVSPIQVSIPSSTPELMANGQSFGFPAKPHSRSITDLPGAPMSPVGQHAYHFPHPYPYMHPPMQPPYSHSMAHLNCAQCLSSSWSNLMSPHPSPYFHPMPWGPPHASLDRGGAAASHGQMKHSHGDLGSYPDPNSHFPYPGNAYYPNGMPVSDPNTLKDLSQQLQPPGSSKVRRSLSNSSRSSRHGKSTEDLQSTADMPMESNPSKSNENVNEGLVNKAKQDTAEEEPRVPVAPNKPWSCLHCTYINPPGIYICQVCCKTSYGNKPASDTEDNRIDSPMDDNRNSESPMELVNMDAEIMSPEFSNLKAQKTDDICQDSLETSLENEEAFKNTDAATDPDPTVMLTTETQTSTTTKSTDVQTQNLVCKSMASSTDSIFPRQEISVQTEVEELPKHCSVATDPMISSHSMESLMSGMSAPPYHNRRAGWGRGTSYSTQSLYERGRSRSPLPRSASLYNESHSLGRDSSLPPEEVLQGWNPAWLMSDPMYYKPHNMPEYGQALTKEDYFDGTWGSMDKLNRRVKSKQAKKQETHGKPKLHRSLDDLKQDKHHELIHSQELQFLQTVKEAERCGFSLEDLHVSYLHCGRENPVFWLEDNWSSMIKNVIALAAKYGEDNEENDVGAISVSEAKDALHIHRGDIWDSVTECIENRQRKILELTVRGNFTQKQISDALTHNEGNVELAYADLFRASNKRHKFILSPGLSEDSEDLNLCIQTEDGKLNVSLDTKIEKKKSDFLTKLSAIRQAQSERRKAREEKEFGRENTGQEFPFELPISPLESFSAIVGGVETSQSAETGEILEATSPVDPIPMNAEVETETISKMEKVESKARSKEDLAIEKKELEEENVELEEENISVDYDANWVDSQGEWIEEYSDEQWDEEGDGQWVSLQNKFHNMEKALAEEAMQMAALWEKEELEDDVFEEETQHVAKIQINESDRLKSEKEEKFQQWVKVNLEKNLSETEEELPNEKNRGIAKELDLAKSVELSDAVISNSPLRDYRTDENALDAEIKEAILSKSVELDDDTIMRNSPLQHYPTEFDLSSKSFIEPDWVEVEQNADTVLDEVTTEAKPENMEKREKQDLYEQEISDGEWEKIDFDDVPVLKDNDSSLPEKYIQGNDTSSFMQPASELGNDFQESPEKQVLQTDAIPTLSNLIADDLVQDKLENTYVYGETERNDGKTVTDASLPKPPVRRKSKLNVSAIQEALQNQKIPSNVTSDVGEIPPALPLKIKDKVCEQNSVSDTYAVPDKINKTKTTKNVNADLEIKDSLKEGQNIPQSAPLKPPRLNIPSTVGFSKDTSPVTSLSNESDSNCFADSESDPEIKIVRQKMHKKYSKFDNEDECQGVSNPDEAKLLDSSNLALDLSSNMSDFGPELPIPVGSRGYRISDDVSSPKAFREGNARPLQLFKATKADAIAPIESSVTNSNNLVSSPTKSIDVNAPIIFDGTSVSLDNNYYNTTSENQNKSELQRSIPTENVNTNQLAEQNELAFNYNADYYNINAEKSIDNEVQGIPEMVDTQFNSKSINVEVSKEDNLSNISHNIELSIPQNIESNISENKEEELNFTDMEATSAVADYFFGRYNEITVTRPKKKVIIKVDKSGMPAMPKPMSSSQIKVTPSTIPSPMVQSASPILGLKSEVETPLKQAPSLNKPSSPVPKREEVLVSKPVPPPVSKPASVPVPEPSPVPTQTDVLSFAEDYFFGSYNEVSVPKKPKAKIVMTKSRPLELSSTHRSALQRVSPAEFEDANANSHVLPSISEASDSFSVSTHSMLDANRTMSGSMPSIPEVCSAIDVTSQALNATMALDDLQESSSSRMDGKVKNVHFEESQPPVVPPPRRNRGQPISKTDEMSENLSAIDQSVLFHPMDFQSSSLSKKKLLPSSEDFKIIQGHDPSEFPCDTPLSTSEISESLLSSEISIRTSEGLKDSPNRILKHEISSENEFEKYSIDLPVPEFSDHTPNFLTTSSAFEESSSPRGYCILENSALNNSAEFSATETEADFMHSTKESNYSEERNLTITDYKLDKDDIQDLSDNSLSIASLEKVDPTSLLENVESNFEARIEQDQNLLDHKENILVSSHDSYEEDSFHLVEQSQNIIHDFCDLYLQDNFHISSANEVENFNVKNNNQDSTYDSEHEWKLNEERNNSLNASFIDNPIYNTASETYKLNIVEKDKLILSSAEILPDEISIDPPLPIQTVEHIAISSDETENLSNRFNLTEDLSSQVESQTAENKDFFLNTEYDLQESNVISENVVSHEVQPLSILCQTIASNLESSSSKEFFSTVAIESFSDEINQTSENTVDTFETRAEHGDVLDHDLNIHSSEKPAMVSSVVDLESTQELNSSEDEDFGNLQEDDEIDLEVLDKPLTELASRAWDDLLTDDEGTEISCSIDFDSSYSANEDQEVEQEISDIAYLETDNENINYITEQYEDIVRMSNDAFPSSDNVSRSTTPSTSEESVIMLSNEIVPPDNISTNVILFTPEDSSKVQSISVLSPDTSTSVTLSKSGDSLIALTSVDLPSDDIPTNVPLMPSEDLTLIQSDAISLEDDISLNVTPSINLQVEEANVLTQIDENTECNEVISETEINEEPSLSLMSHFYDEWFENVRSSETSEVQKDLLSIYASYSPSHSSASSIGNVSDTEDFVEVKKEDFKSHELSPADSLRMDDTFSSNIASVNYDEDPYPMSVSEMENNDTTANQIVVEIPTEDESVVVSTLQDEFVSFSESLQTLSMNDEFDKISEKRTTEALLQQELEVLKITTDTANQNEAVEDNASEIIHSEKQSFRTSKSCQTEDSFEEEQFFDSFDDTFTIPSFVNLPFTKSLLEQPIKMEIGIQCSLISDESAMVSDIIYKQLGPSIATKQDSEFTQAQDTSFIEDFYEDDSEMISAASSVQKGHKNVADNEIGSSSSESVEDSDSDFFLESHSSYDELDIESKDRKSLKYSIYADIDSDTGFSSGSDTGKHTLKLRHYTDKGNLSSTKDSSVKFNRTGVQISSQLKTSSAAVIETVEDSSKASSSNTTMVTGDKNHEYCTTEEVVHNVNSQNGTNQNTENSFQTVLPAEKITEFGLSEEVVKDICKSITCLVEENDKSPNIECSISEVISQSVVPVSEIISNDFSLQPSTNVKQSAEKIEKVKDIESEFPEKDAKYTSESITCLVEENDKPPNIECSISEVISQNVVPESEIVSNDFSLQPSTNVKQSKIMLPSEKIEKEKYIESESREKDAKYTRENISHSVKDNINIECSTSENSLQSIVSESNIISNDSTSNSVLLQSPTNGEHAEIHEIKKTETVIKKTVTLDEINPDVLSRAMSDKITPSKSKEHPHNVGIELGTRLSDEIIERAITPISIEKTALYESDIEFVEVDYTIESPSYVQYNTEEGKSVAPTVEYFYGSLPSSVQGEILPDRKDSFFEALEILDDCVSHIQKNISDHEHLYNLPQRETSNSSLPTIEKDSSENFCDADSSLKEEDDFNSDSISEEFALPEDRFTEPLIQSSYKPKSESLQSSLRDQENQSFVLSSDVMAQEIFESTCNDFSENVVSTEELENEINASATGILSDQSSQFEGSLCSESEHWGVPQEDVLTRRVAEKMQEHVSQNEIVEEYEMAHSLLVENNAKTLKTLCENELSKCEEGNVPILEDLESTALSTVSREVQSQIDVSSDTTIRKTFEIPPVPSHMIRYLYYDDSIQFEDEDISKSESTYSFQTSPMSAKLELEDSPENPTEITEPLKKTDDPQLHQIPECEFNKQLVKASSNISDPEAEQTEFNVPKKDTDDFTSNDTENFELAHSKSENIDQTFELDTSLSLQTSCSEFQSMQNSEEQLKFETTSTQSDLPCIPMFTGNQEMNGNVIDLKVDSDEMTDISTHFTMTDDSDKFSDIESDTSLTDDRCYLDIEDLSRSGEVDSFVNQKELDAKVKEVEAVISETRLSDSLSIDQCLMQEEIQEVDLNGNVAVCQNDLNLSMEARLRIPDSFEDKIVINEIEEPDGRAEVSSTAEKIFYNVCSKDNNQFDTSFADKSHLSQLECSEYFLATDNITSQTKDLQTSEASNILIAEKVMCDAKEALVAPLDAVNREIITSVEQKNFANDIKLISSDGNMKVDIEIDQCSTEKEICSNNVLNLSSTTNDVNDSVNDKQKNVNDDILLPVSLEQKDIKKEEKSLDALEYFEQLPSMSDVMQGKSISNSNDEKISIIGSENNLHETKEFKNEIDAGERGTIVPDSVVAPSVLPDFSQTDNLLSSEIIEESFPAFDFKECLVREEKVLNYVSSAKTEDTSDLKVTEEGCSTVDFKGICISQEEREKVIDGTQLESLSSSQSNEVNLSVNIKESVTHAESILNRTNNLHSSKVDLVSFKGNLICEESNLSEANVNIENSLDSGALKEIVSNIDFKNCLPGEESVKKVDVSKDFRNLPITEESSLTVDFRGFPISEETVLKKLDCAQTEVIFDSQITEESQIAVDFKGTFQSAKKSTEEINCQVVKDSSLITTEESISAVDFKGFPKSEEIVLNNMGSIQSNISPNLQVAEEKESAVNFKGTTISAVKESDGQAAKEDSFFVDFKGKLLREENDNDTSKSENIDESMLCDKSRESLLLNVTDTKHQELSFKREEIHFYDHMDNMYEHTLSSCHSDLENSFVSCNGAESSPYYSAQEDADDTLNITSDDEFTDVASHVTLTEGTDPWSDVEADEFLDVGDLEVDEFSLTRDVTPTRDSIDNTSVKNLTHISVFNSSDDSISQYEIIDNQNYIQEDKNRKSGESTCKAENLIIETSEMYTDSECIAENQELRQISYSKDSIEIEEENQVENCERLMTDTISKVALKDHDDSQILTKYILENQVLKLDQNFSEISATDRNITSEDTDDLSISVSEEFIETTSGECEKWSDIETINQLTDKLDSSHGTIFDSIDKVDENKPSSTEEKISSVTPIADINAKEGSGISYPDMQKSQEDQQFQSSTENAQQTILERKPKASETDTADIMVKEIESVNFDDSETSYPDALSKNQCHSSMADKAEICSDDSGLVNKSYYSADQNKVIASVKEDIPSSNYDTQLSDENIGSNTLEITCVNEISISNKNITEDKIQSLEDNNKHISMLSSEPDKVNLETKITEESASIVSSKGKEIDSIDTVSQDFTDTVSFNSITDECEILSDSEATSPLDDLSFMETETSNELGQPSALLDIEEKSIIFTEIQSKEISTDIVKSIETENTTISDENNLRFMKQSECQVISSVTEEVSVDSLVKQDFNQLGGVTSDGAIDTTSYDSITGECEELSESDVTSLLEDSPLQMIESIENTETDKEIVPIVSTNKELAEKSSCFTEDSSENALNKNIVTDLENLKLTVASEKISTDADSSTLVIDESNKYSDTKITNLVDEFSPESPGISAPCDEKNLNVQFATATQKFSEMQSTGNITEHLFIEHFAEVKSMGEFLSVVESFAVFDVDTAIQKIHEETTEASLRIEKTEESDYWLEADTEYSISEFEDEAMSISDKELSNQILVPVANVFDASEDNKNAYKTASQLSNENATEMSVSSFFTDPEYSEQISDTCADISLQGATTDNSDKWSDMEGDGLIEDIHFSTEQTIDIDKRSLGVSADDKDDHELVLDKCILELEINAADADILRKASAPFDNLKEACAETNASKLDASNTVKCLVEPATTVEEAVSFSNNVLNVSLKKTTSNTITTSEQGKSQLLAETSISSVSGLSDEEFTSVTPLDVTADESDKWSDVSDKSIEEIKEDSASASFKEVIIDNIPEEVLSDEASLNLKSQPSKSDNSIQDIKVKSENNSSGPEKIPLDTKFDSTFASFRSDSKSNQLSTASNLIECEVKEQINVSDERLNDVASIQADIDMKPSSESPNEYEIEEDAYEYNDLENDEFLEENEEFLEEADEFDQNNEIELDENGYASAPYIINDDELVYPLQYQDWIGESFDLKEYGIDTVLSGSESDVHGYGISEEFEDIERSFDFNANNFDETLESIMEEEKNLTTESFKTLSNGVSSHLKTSDKEHDSWSTADSASIEDEFPDHDDVLTRIDELLAEDFKDFATDYKDSDERELERPEFSPSGDFTEQDNPSSSNLLQLGKDVIEADVYYGDSISRNNITAEQEASKMKIETQEFVSKVNIEEDNKTVYVSDNLVIGDNFECPKKDKGPSKSSVKLFSTIESDSEKLELKLQTEDTITSSKQSVSQSKKDTSESIVSLSAKELEKPADILLCSTKEQSSRASSEKDTDLTECDNLGDSKSNKNIKEAKTNLLDQNSREEEIKSIADNSKSKKKKSITKEDIKTDISALEKSAENTFAIIKSDMKSSHSEEVALSATVTVKPDIPCKQKNKTDSTTKLTLSQTVNISSDIITASEKTSDVSDGALKVSIKEEAAANELKTDIPFKKEDDNINTTVKSSDINETPALPRKRRRGVPSLEAASSTESLSSCDSSSSEGNKDSNIIPDVPVRRRRSTQSPAVRSRSRSNSDDNSTSSNKSSIHSKSSPAPDLPRKRLSIDERVAKLQNEGKCSNSEIAFIAAKLIEMQFEEEDALLASKQCSSVYHAVKFLTQLCDLCNCRFPINLMVSMVHCTHRACRECLKAHFTSLIYDRSIFNLLCPVCHMPDITDQNIQEYFNHLDQMLRNILERGVYDLFQRKLRDEVLTKDPNFHWCSQCSSGFIASPRLKKLYCPDCSAITCASCHQTWELEHEGVHCERFQQWKDMHTPEPPPAGLVKYLTDRGINCPSCGLLYAQACGGCLMYKCSHCSYEFCGFCSQPFKKGKECSIETCISRGMHAHHPFSCLFFLRDKEISDIQMLLQEESVKYLTIPPKDQIVKTRCQVREQKHNHGAISEDRCGRDIVPYCAGLCTTHYYEYLAELLRKKKISPLSIMTIQDLQFMLRKSRVYVPERVKGETNDEYYKRLTEAVTNSLT